MDLKIDVGFCIPGCNDCCNMTKNLGFTQDYNFIDNITKEIQDKSYINENMFLVIDKQEGKYFLSKNCPFNSKNLGDELSFCTIYSNRPTGCRDFKCDYFKKIEELSKNHNIKEFLTESFSSHKNEYFIYLSAVKTFVKLLPTNKKVDLNCFEQIFELKKEEIKKFQELDEKLTDLEILLEEKESECRDLVLELSPNITEFNGDEVLSNRNEYYFSVDDYVDSLMDVENKDNVLELIEDMEEFRKEFYEIKELKKNEEKLKSKYNYNYKQLINENISY